MSKILETKSTNMLSPKEECLQYEKAGYWYIDDTLYYNHSAVDYFDAYNIMPHSQTTSEFKKYCNYKNSADKKTNKFKLGLELVEKGWKSWYGAIYNKDNKLVSEKDFKKAVSKYFAPTFDQQQLDTLVDVIYEQGQVEHIPPYQLPKGTPKDNGFRFPKIAYQLMHYFLFEQKQKYIFTMMSEGNMGKSTFSNFLMHLFKGETFSSDAKFINQFTTGSIASSRLTIFNDCTSERLENTHIIKQISSSDLMQIEKKGVQAVSGKVECHLLYIGNENLTYDVLDTGLSNRFINLPWEQEIKTKDAKWVNYNWTIDEVLFQVELAKNVDVLDYKTLQEQTIKTALKEHAAFVYDNYNVYKENCKYAYSQRNFSRFWKLVCKYFTKDEWDKIVNSDVYFGGWNNVKIKDNIT